MRYNPYAAPGRRVHDSSPPTPALPVGRLRRLGASDRVVEVLGHWWDGFPQGDEAHVAVALSEMTDTEMGEWMAHADVPDGTVDAVMEWVGNTEDRKLGAYMALLVEEQAEKPRVTLVNTLRSLTAG